MVEKRKNQTISKLSLLKMKTSKNVKAYKGIKLTNYTDLQQKCCLDVLNGFLCI